MALITIARDLKRNFRPWIHALRQRICWIYHLRRRYIIAETMRRVTGKAPPYDTYATDEEEQKYWEEASRSLRELQSSDAMYTGKKKIKARLKPVDPPPLVMYYTPVLPRYQRTKEERRRTPLSYKQEMRHRRKMTADIYIRWHWMTHPDSVGLFSAESESMWLLTGHIS